MMVISVVARNAHAFVSSPSEIQGDGQCYPLPRAFTLGEHMLGTGLLAAAPYAMTRDPIVSYNAAVLLSLWLPGVAMYALASLLTGSPAAAFASGLLFALEPARLLDPGHPFGHADLWAPLVLLFLHRTFARARLRDAAGLALFGSLQTLESLYPLLGAAVIALSYGLLLAWRLRARLARAAPLLAAAAAVVAGVAFLVLGPYLDARSTWGVLAGRRAILLPASDYLPPGRASPGWIALALGAVGLADRLRRRREVEGVDPRFALLAAGLALLWLGMRPLDLPGGWRLPSGYAVARAWIPGVSAVRVLTAVGLTAWLPLSLLAGYGVLAILERRRPIAAAAVTIALAAAILLERFEPAVARLSFPLPVVLGAREMRPRALDVRLMRERVEPPVFPLPFPAPEERFARLGAAHFLLLQAFRPGPTAACYNSFASPLTSPLHALAARLPDAEAAQALSALGFRTLLLHRGLFLAGQVDAFERAIASDPDRRRWLRPIGEGARLVAFRLAPVATTSALTALSPVETRGRPEEVSLPGALTFRVRNRSERAFRHADPIAPRLLEIRWTDFAGREVARESVRGLLPLALAPGGAGEISIVAQGPARAGAYWAELRLPRGRRPALTIARRPVTAGLGADEAGW